ncbi:Sodium/proton antiporter nhaA [Anaerobiospirillum thomasii]|uniref:Na(+)/H(+) antiporter NhaA n=1 Tax=Anaerobiospirillum thomasii TaxID=179995 RepID=A0A2X0WCW9_9GAMM|nr:Na+/H+ antiporter NhaA [Anaerobiospirillum thomasii]SPT68137.1 Sodium/proton antiporter nhaA [Anaerobiospirillum thomasii]SPT70607.1 Sodium/proton antiporter nhaA [Anaerobiospirillum thomasii]
MKHKIRNTIHDITHHDATAGIIMIFLTIIALLYQNSTYGVDYRQWLDTHAGFIFGSFELVKPILLWINDGFITIFFFAIGLELKHEFMEGHLSKLSNVTLPALAALGGIVFPALTFCAFNVGDDYALRGWAIPAATDAAFSVAILLMLGSRVPPSLKIFLLSLAIFDDIGAIIVIALFYTSELSVLALSSACIAIFVLALLNFMSVQRKSLYYIVGAILWFSILKSGVHATLAGIITAFFIPLKRNDGTPLVNEIYDHSKMWISVFILPLFAFANAGVDLSGVSVESLFSGVSLGIFLGLFVGKQLGVFIVCYICIKLKLASMPKDATLSQLYGVAILTGIGFTMSMFVDGLAYGGSDIYAYTDSLAIILGSTLSGIIGYLFLRFYPHVRNKA